ncbi:MAG: hypothetical protein M5U01_19565 [Ardenticatenaceae bacterium]|nr:hypothetical protein [Ardenticatenaceae bacterium]
MNDGATLTADLESAEAVQSGQGSFGHPAMSTQPLTGVEAPASDAALDAPLAKGDWVIATRAPDPLLLRGIFPHLFV